LVRAVTNMSTAASPDILRIVLLIRSLETGGTQRQVMALARGLAQRGHHVTVAAFYARSNPWPAVEGGRVRLALVNKKSRWHLASFFFGLVALIRRTQPDVVYSFLPDANLLAMLAKPFAGWPATVWSIRASIVDLRRTDFLSRLFYALQRRMARLADHIVVNSNAGFRHHLPNSFPAGRCSIIFNGIDCNALRVERKAGLPLRSAWGVNPDQKLVGIVARLDPIKDHETFLAAAARIAEHRGDVLFVCVGGGGTALKRQLEASQVRLGLGGRVIWAGEQADMLAVYNALDLLVLTSIGEGFPNVLAEAMACGLACVSTEAGEAQTILGDEGKVVPVGDADAIAEACLRCLDAEAKAGGDVRNHRHSMIAKRFGLETLYDLTETTLRQVVRQRES
jgi:glycosyltransferase involved in cell wall biosynthesis